MEQRRDTKGIEVILELCQRNWSHSKHLVEKNFHKVMLRVPETQTGSDGRQESGKSKQRLNRMVFWAVYCLEIRFCLWILVGHSRWRGELAAIVFRGWSLHTNVFDWWMSFALGSALCVILKYIPTKNDPILSGFICCLFQHSTQ